MNRAAVSPNNMKSVFSGGILSDPHHTLLCLLCWEGKCLNLSMVLVCCDLSENQNWLVKGPSLPQEWLAVCWAGLSAIPTNGTGVVTCCRTCGASP